MRTPRPRSLTLTLTLLAVISLSASLNLAAAQDTATVAPSAAMLRRLAEAVDAQRDDQPVWVVIQRTVPYAVAGVYHSRTQGAAMAARLAGFVQLGPFRTPVDPGTPTMLMSLALCPFGRHDVYSDCSDSTRSGVGVSAMAVSDVDSVAVTLYGKRGAQIHRAFAPDQVDALFFTPSAVDKFVVPYYTRLYGPAMAATMREAYLRQIGGATRLY